PRLHRKNREPARTALPPKISPPMETARTLAEPRGDIKAPLHRHSRHNYHLPVHVASAQIAQHPIHIPDHITRPRRIADNAPPVIAFTAVRPKVCRGVNGPTEAGRPLVC